MDLATDKTDARGAKRVRTDTTNTTPSEKAASKQQRKSPTKAALDTLEQQIESLPDNLAQIAKHFGNQLIRLRAKLFNKTAVSKRMQDDADYIPKSARASDFEITTSKAAVEKYTERIELLNQQVAQAKMLYQQSLKTVIQECAEMEIEAMKDEENNLVSEILEKMANATNAANDNNCNVHLKVSNIIRYDPKIFKYGTATTRNEIRNKYMAFHGLDTLPAPSVVTIRGNDYQTQEEAVTAQAEAAASMQLPENKDFHQYRKLLEIVLFLPSRAFHLQHEQNKKDTVMKKLVTEIIDGTKTEEAAMELENEAAANMEQLQDLIRKESDKRDKKYKDLEQKYSALQKEMKALSQQKTPAKNNNMGGRPSAPTNQRNTGNRRNDNKNAATNRNENRENRDNRGGGRGRGRTGTRTRGQQRSTSRSGMRRGTNNRNRNDRNNSRRDRRADDDSNDSENDYRRKRGNRSRMPSRSRSRRS